jgi:hypothetical protein
MEQGQSMTDTINLPPLPKPHTDLVIGHTDDALEDYARAAVLADRQTREKELVELLREAKPSVVAHQSLVCGDAIYRLFDLRDRINAAVGFADPLADAGKPINTLPSAPHPADVSQNGEEHDTSDHIADAGKKVEGAA